MHEQLANIRLKFQANRLTANNQDGLLVQNEMAYLNCLVFDPRPLEELFRKDAAHWDQELERAKQEAVNVQERLRLYLEQHRLGLQQLITN